MTTIFLSGLFYFCSSAFLDIALYFHFYSFGRYCLADDRLIDAVRFLDLGDGAGWELLQVLLYFLIMMSITWCTHYIFLSTC